MEKIAEVQTLVLNLLTGESFPHCQRTPVKGAGLSCHLHETFEILEK
jgi:hypothetical protein